MPGPIVLEYGSGLSRGIEQAGNAIAQALGIRAKEQKFRKSASALDEALQSLPENPTAIDLQKTMMRVSQQKDVDPNYVQETFKTLMPLYQEKIKAGEGMRMLQQIFPQSQMFGGATQEPSQLDSLGTQGLIENPQGLMSGNMGQPSSIMSQFSNVQAQQQNLQPTEKYTIESPGLGNVNRSQIDALLVSPYDNMQRLGQALDQRWRDQYKQSSKEQADIRKEYRDQITKYSEPYQDISKLQTNVNKLKEAEKLIDSGKVSLDDNWTRNAIQGILEGRESPLAEIAKTPEQQKLWYLLKDSLRTKDIGGSNPSTKEVLLSMSTLPNPYKSQSSNKFIIKNLINQGETDLHKGQEIARLRKGSGPISYAEFQSKIDSSVGSFMEKKQQELDKMMTIQTAKDTIKGKTPASGFVWAMKPDGTVGQVPISDIKRVQDAQGVILSDLGKKK